MTDDGVLPRRAVRVFVSLAQHALGYLIFKYVISVVIRIVVWRSHWQPAINVMRRP